MSHSQTESIREFILDCVADGPNSVARQVAEAYGISRQAANRHLDALVEAEILEEEGNTRSKTYRLRRTSLLNREIRVTPVLNPDRLWDDHIAPVLADDQADLRDLCRGVFGELIRNVIQHAGASWITVAFASSGGHFVVGFGEVGGGVFFGLMDRFGVASGREAADLMTRHANARSKDFPASHLVLLARNFESFSL
jgi:DNA-binding transcriptional ArsR family regulator